MRVVPVTIGDAEHRDRPVLSADKEHGRTRKVISDQAAAPGGDQRVPAERVGFEPTVARTTTTAFEAVLPGYPQLWINLPFP